MHESPIFSLKPSKPPITDYKVRHRSHENPLHCKGHYSRPELALKREKSDPGTHSFCPAARPARASLRRGIVLKQCVLNRGSTVQRLVFLDPRDGYGNDSTRKLLLSRRCRALLTILEIPYLHQHLPMIRSACRTPQNMTSDAFHLPSILDPAPPSIARVLTECL